MNKFSIEPIEYPKHFDEEKPVLYKVWFGNNYYLHKGKKLQESLDRFLDDVFRGIRNKVCPEYYSEVVAHCKRYPAIHKVSVEVVLNDDPDKILKKEDSLYRAMKKDQYSLNTDKRYTPEWMLKQSLQKRCETCITSGVVANKKMQFNFCPNCGRLNK